jgi:putative effector of murein hydrolase LrgA (UPF0299 family)
MPERTAKILETSGHGTTIATTSAGIGMWLSSSVDWLNENYLAIMAICAITTCIVGCYGTIARVRLAKQQKRRTDDK